MQSRDTESERLRVLAEEPQGAHGDASEAPAEADGSSQAWVEVWDYLLRIGDSEHPPASGDPQEPEDPGGSWYWVVLVGLIMLMTGATILGIATDIL